MMRPFYFIRHGETDWNKQEKLQGHSNIPLNSLGRSQAESLCEFVTTLQSPKIFSSDLDRAFETARIAAPQFDITTDQRLREVSLGQAEGAPRHQLGNLFGEELVTAWFSNEPESLMRRFPGGESRREAIDRTHLLLREVSAQMKDQSLVFFSHGLLMRSFAEQSLLQGVPRSLTEIRPQLRAPNCSVYEFEWHDSFPKLRQIYWLCS